MVNARGARVLITDMAQGRIWEEYVDPLRSEEKVYKAMRDTLDPMVRPTPREHLEKTLPTIVEPMLRAYKETGRARWPGSVERTLGEIALATHDPTLVQEATSVEQIITQGRAFARHITEHAAKY